MDARQCRCSGSCSAKSASQQVVLSVHRRDKPAACSCTNRIGTFIGLSVPQRCDDSSEVRDSCDRAGASELGHSYRRRFSRPWDLIRWKRQNSLNHRSHHNPSRNRCSHCQDASCGTAASELRSLALIRRAARKVRRPIQLVDTLSLGANQTGKADSKEAAHPFGSPRRPVLCSEPLFVGFGRDAQNEEHARCK